MRTTLLRAACAAVLIAVPLAGCGGGSSTDTGGSASSSTPAADVKVEAVSLAYTATKYTAKAGTFTIELDNQDPVAHNVTLVEGNKLLVEADAKKSHTATATLAAGSYAVYCTIPGHNMHATITVS
jgi:plastocyanin